MFELSLNNAREPKCVLLIGAHCDDLEIGCGGTVLQMAGRWPGAKFVWITLSSDAERALETRLAAQNLLMPAVNQVVLVESFRASYFPHDWAAMKDYFETLKAHKPDLILTHCRGDLHQDHRIINELTWNTFRDHLILEYEIPKFDGDLGVPNMFVPMSRQILEQKIQILLDSFHSQKHRHWFTRNTFEAIARLRGIECNAADGFAEAFYCRKGRLLL